MFYFKNEINNKYRIFSGKDTFCQKVDTRLAAVKAGASMISLSADQALPYVISFLCLTEAVREKWSTISTLKPVSTVQFSYYTGNLLKQHYIL